jgi:hypothetical protein
MMLEVPPPLTDEEWDAIFRDGATDEEIESVLRHVFYWAWIGRDPLGKMCATGRDATRAEAIRYAFELADAYAIDLFSTLADPTDEYAQ